MTHWSGIPLTVPVPFTTTEGSFTIGPTRTRRRS